MILYHGTNVAFDEVDLLKGLPGKDFGRGFYLTNSLECAIKTGKNRVDRLGGRLFVKRYNVNESDFSGLSIKRFAVPSREWALFVRSNRRGDSDSVDHNRDNRYDIVIGPIANDKLSLQFRLFDKGLISLDAFVDGLQFNQLYMQYSFHTAKAVSILKYEGDEKV